MLNNTDSRLGSFRDRIIRLETERRERAEDIKEVYTEMKGRAHTKAEIAGVKLAVKRSFETDAKLRDRLDAEEVAASLGDFGKLPLGLAAIDAAG
jgi:uncharacterized protein (UPF0335 family)